VVFDAMRRAIARGTGLTRHLLAFSRRRPVKPESIDVAAHLHGMRAMLDGSLGGHIKVEMRFASDLWPIEGDAGEMELAILNLCVNARDALPDGGVITIAAENVHSMAGAGPSVECVKISVADDGCGMPRDVLARVFEPFFTTKDISKGSGLGLPQVYGFATQSGGEVTVDSAVGTGTIVTLILPRSLESPVSDLQARERVPVVPPRDSARRGHVLLVEDDHEVSALTRELLSALGFAVTHVVSAEGAIAALAGAHGIDLMLSDVMMPGGVSGLQLARQIREDYPDLPIILATGYIEAVAGMQDGEFQLLTKPFTLEALADALGVEAR
jgi:CheY-like chemotaxis protein